jgi:hypothetical protein
VISLRYRLVNRSLITVVSFGPATYTPSNDNGAMS